METNPQHPEIEKIIWDADNTFWNWIRYAAKAYQAMTECIVNETALPPKEVEQAMKYFYSQAGTIEDSGLIQGLEASGLFSGVKTYDRERMISKVREVFNEMRNKYFKTYANIGKVLRAAHEMGKENIVLSDAPGIHATQRLIRSKLHPHISRVYARKSRKIEDLPADIREKMSRRKYDPPFEVIEIESEKPGTDLEWILKLNGQPAENAEYIRRHVAIIGDNPAKDMALAVKWGCLGLQAMWGQANAEDIKTMGKFAPAAVQARNFSLPDTPDADPSPDHPGIIKVARPEDLMSILGL